MPEENTGNILKRLWILFWLSIISPLLLFIAVVIIHQMGIIIIAPGNIRVWGILLLVLSVSFGVALPVLFRTSFHGNYLKTKKVTLSDYFIYQRKMVVVCAVSIIPASGAYLLIVSPLYMYGSILAALYGIYSTLPFSDKIVNELKMYSLWNQD